jgi:epoxyqueuosine reductase
MNPLRDDPEFIRNLEKEGVLARVVSIDHLDELGSEVRALHDSGRLDDAFFRDYAKPFFSPKPPEKLPGAKSIIVMAIPQPMLRATFSWKGKEVRGVVPPTYADYQRVFRRERRLLTDAFGNEKHRLVKAVLPLKLLAVRSGLAMYGRNNVTYIQKLGSFYRLMAFYSDYDSPVDNWREKKALPLCSKCTACMKACPTGAIQKDRFLIRAERCLSYLNEKDSEHAFPKWVDASAHNSIVGCMRCQRACPYDKEFTGWCEDRVRFSEDETAYLLRGKYSGAKAAKIEKKLKTVGLDLSIFPRNLEALIGQLDR